MKKSYKGLFLWLIIYLLGFVPMFGIDDGADTVVHICYDYSSDADNKKYRQCLLDKRSLF